MNVQSTADKVISLQGPFMLFKQTGVRILHFLCTKFS